MKREQKELNKKNDTKAEVDDKKAKKPRKSVDTKNFDEDNAKLPNLENKKSKKSEKSDNKEKSKTLGAIKSKQKPTPVDELIDETIKDATVNSSKKSNIKILNESKNKIKKPSTDLKKRPVHEAKDKIKKKSVNEPKKEFKKKPVDELIDETLSEINIESNNKTIEGLEIDTMSDSIDKPIKTPVDKKNKKLTKNAIKPTKKSIDGSIKTLKKAVDEPDTKPIKKAIDESVDSPSKKLKKNISSDLNEKFNESKDNLINNKEDASDKTDQGISDFKQPNEEFKTNLFNKKTDDVFKLKISKNSIKMKNIESIYPNNIGVEETKTSFLILYKNAKTAKKDLRLNEKYKFHNDKLIISNLSYKETEESIKNFLSDFGEVVDISLEKNKDDVFTGKAVVTFESSVKIDKELKLNNKILRVERIRKQAVNDKRIFIGRIDMNLSIMDIRKVIKEAGARVTDVRIRYEKDTHKNIGYGHLSFKTREDAIKFENNFQNIKKTLGPHSFYEYAKEKFMAPRKR